VGVLATCVAKPACGVVVQPEKSLRMIGRKRESANTACVALVVERVLRPMKPNTKGVRVIVKMHTRKANEGGVMLQKDELGCKRKREREGTHAEDMRERDAQCTHVRPPTTVPNFQKSSEIDH
jgi:hypothetical protein